MRPSEKVRKPIVLIASLALAMLAGFLLGKRDSAAPKEATNFRILYYVDPMHPSFKSDKPGTAPDCGMDLVPVYADEGQTERPRTNDKNFTVSDLNRRLIGLRIETVEASSLRTNIRVLGKVQAEEGRIHLLNAAIDGWVQDTTEVSSGDVVKKDQVLATFYSPEFFAAQQAFISSQERFQVAGGETQLTIAKQNGIADRLRNLGMSDVQLNKLSKTKQATNRIEIVSPVDGFVLDRKISATQRFEKGQEFYRIAELSRVWVVAEVFEGDVARFRSGATARVTIPHSSRRIAARVTNVLPEFDSASRTYRVRLEAMNEGLALRPGMVVDVGLSVSLGSRPTVAADAVLDAGLNKHVFVELADGSFELRDVKTGERTDHRIQVLKGLSPGDRVVVSGSFFLDSETRLRAVQSRLPRGGRTGQ